VGGQLDAQGKRALIEKYLEFRLLMLKIDPAEDGDEEAEERLASAMRTYQVTESPIPNEVSSVAPMMGAPVIVGTTTATTPSKSRKSSKGVKSPRSEKSAKKKHRKRKRKIDSDDSSDNSDCDPDFRA
jgi:hypothetical protein